MAKLTSAQLELLTEIAEKPRNCVKAYKPGPALVVRGLADWLNDDGYAGTLVITDAGRAALQEAGR